MTTPSYPLNRRFPNRSKALEEGIPILCSILFGFAGAYFAAISVIRPDELGERKFECVFVIGSIIGSGWDFQVKNAVMVLSAICCACFYISVIGAIYAKMVNTDEIASKLGAGRSDEQKAVDNDIITRRIGQREKYFFVSLAAFNTGIFVLPFSLFAVMPDGTFAAVTIAYLIIVAAFALSGSGT
ncbi:MAG TPA: hypothetical protein VEI03_18200 [Stellaceae bacterium]|nr:hypothetical protein [Stellaceae bacterium]